MDMVLRRRFGIRRRAGDQIFAGRSSSNSQTASAMTHNFRVALGVVCLTVATVAIGLAPAIPEATAFMALAFLVWYHIGYLAGKLPLWLNAPKRLADSEIDSVYYVGFLVTVTELAASALILLRGSLDPKPILIRFAVGLL